MESSALRRSDEDPLARGGPSCFAEAIRQCERFGLKALWCPPSVRLGLNFGADAPLSDAARCLIIIAVTASSEANLFAGLTRR